MSNWTVHWSGLGASLEPWSAHILDDFQRAEAALAAKAHVPALDILVAGRDPSAVIPELGMGAWAMSPTLVIVAVAPDCQTFETALNDGAIARQIVHEANHCLRWSAGPRARTLGEAIVSEGLAGHYVAHVLDTPPEPWERAVPSGQLSQWMPGGDELARTGYNHSDWFFGTGDYPRWLGYTLGYDLIGRWLAQEGSTRTVEDRYAVAADRVLSDVLKSNEY